MIEEWVGQVSFNKIHSYIGSQNNIVSGWATLFELWNLVRHRIGVSFINLTFISARVKRYMAPCSNMTGFVQRASVSDVGGLVDKRVLEPRNTSESMTARKLGEDTRRPKVSTMRQSKILAIEQL